MGNPWTNLTQQVQTQAQYLIGFLLVCVVLMIALGVTKGSLGGQIANFFGMPNAVGRAWMVVIDVFVLAAPALLVGVLTSTVVSTFLPSGEVNIAVPSFTVTVNSSNEAPALDAAADQ